MNPTFRKLRRSLSNEPVVTYALIALTALVFLLQLVPGLGVTQEFLYAGVYSSKMAFEPWRLITSVFIHSTGFIFHILLNMFSLYMFGRLLEAFLGHARFLVLYLLSGLAGSVGVLLLASPRQAVLGASGAVFGLVGAYLVIQRRLGGPTAQLLVLVGINLVIGFIPGFDIAWQAHVGGLTVGALIGLIFLETRERRLKALQIGLLSGLAGLLVIVAVWPALLPGLSTGL